MKLTAANLAFWRGLADGFPEIPALLISGWAQSYRVLSRESSAGSGKWDNADIPYQVEPMDAPLDPGVSETVMQWAAQMGKSEVLNNQLGFYMHSDPAPQLMVQPTIELAEAYSKERIAPMIRDTPVLREIIRDPRSRDSGNTLLSKVYPGGNLALVGANAPSGLAGRPRRVILQDEVDRYPDSAGTEGDPSALADVRAKSYPNAVKVKTSTPTIKGLSKIENRLEQSDCRKWHVSCPKCNHLQVLLWSQVKWPEGKPEEAWLECQNPECLARLCDAERIAMVKAGRWVATKPFSGIRGYWLNGLNTLFRWQKGFNNGLHQFAKEFLEAKDGGAERMKTWTNTFLAETYEEAGEAIDPVELANRVEAYDATAMLPRGGYVIAGGADVQGDRIEAELDIYGADEECWGIIYRVFYGDVRKGEVWQDLDNFLMGEFEHPCGKKLAVERFFIDCGYAMDRVLAFTAPRASRGVFACRGVNRVGIQVPPLLPPRPSRNNKARVPFWPVGVTVAKTAVYSRLVMLPGGPRTIHFPQMDRPDGSTETFGFDDQYFKQLTAEKMRTRFSHGQPYKIFEKDNNAVRNEAIDIRVYSLAALHSLMPIRWHKVKESFEHHEKEHAKETGNRNDSRNSGDVGDKDRRGDSDKNIDRPEQELRQPDGPANTTVPKQPARPFVPRNPARRGGFVKGWR